MSVSAGQVSIDLILNSKNFKNQLNKSVNDAVKSTASSTASTVKSTFAGLGKIAAAAFSTKMIMDFSKSCIELGSTLQEVQNVVDVTYGSMAREANKFAQSAITNYGLSETVAKQYLGTFGAMAKSFGYSTEEALALSESLTGLVGDVSSFYNLDSKTAYTKLKAVFTGETEGLKDLGVVMTQTALDQYALSKGFGKTTKQMAEQEKVALRYQFVMEKLSGASGDFIRTQDGWANQTRVLALQWDSFKANLGQGFIAVLTPVIKILNELMTKLVQLSAVFKETMEGIFGAQETSNPISSISTEMSDLASNTEGVGSAAENAAKKIRRSLMSFDKLNILADNSSGSSGGSGGGTGVTTDFNTEIEREGDTAEKTVNPLINKLKELANLFKTGFKEGLGNSSLKETKKHINDIGKSLKDIFNDPAVKSAGESYANSLMLNFGRVSGSAASIGVTISENLTGGMALNLQEKAPRIKKWLVDMFDISAEKENIKGQFSIVIADIFSVLRNDDAKLLTANIMGSFEELLMFFTGFGERLSLEVLKSVTQPITDNAAQIKLALEGLISWFAERWQTMNTTISEFSDLFFTNWETKIAPAAQGIRDNFSEIFGNFLENWNEHIKPALIEVGEMLDEVMTEHLAPLGEAWVEFSGKVTELLAGIMSVLTPIFNFIVDTVVPKLANNLQFVGDVFGEVVGFAIGRMTAFINKMSGLLDFVIGVFSGDWKRAWSGIKQAFESTFGLIGDVAKGIINIIISAMNRVIRGFNSISVDIPSWVPKYGGQTFGINIPEIPHLAQGAYFGANKPQVAVIGDNKREGEIVAPESKIREQVVTAMQPLITAIQQLITMMQNGTADSGDIVIPVYLGNEVLDTYIINAEKRQIIRTGGR